MDLLLRSAGPAFQAATSAYEAIPSFGATKAAAGALGTVTFFVLIVVALVATVRVFQPTAGLDSSSPSAYVRHILVQHEKVALQLKQEMAHKAGKALLADFQRHAAQNSSCSSGAIGGALGCIGPGKMAPAFDSVVWSAPVMVLQGPVQSAAGFHLILVIKRSLPLDEAKKDS